MSEILRTYMIIVAGCLLIAGAILAIATWGFQRNVCAVWVRYGGWLVIIPILFACFFLGPPALVGLITALAIAGQSEFSKATDLGRNRLWMVLLILLVVLTNGCALLPQMGVEANAMRLFLAMPAMAVAILLIVPILLDEFQGQLRTVSLAIFGYVYLGWMFGHLAILTISRHAEGYLLFFLFAIAVNDIAAFTFGQIFGRHPLRKKISPQKSWEGALGATAVSLGLPWLLDFSFPPGLDGTHKLLIGVIVGAGGHIGDLVMSYIKRDLGVKDMGRIIPGHGGILDRFDSMIFSAPLLTHMLSLSGLL